MSLSQSILLCAAVFYGLAFLAAYVIHNWAEWRYRRAKSLLGKVLSSHESLERWEERKIKNNHPRNPTTLAEPASFNDIKSNYGKSRM